MIYHTIFVNDISKGYRDKSELLLELNGYVTENLLGLQETISNALDFNAGTKRGRPVIKFGLDENLDASKGTLKSIFNIIYILVIWKVLMIVFKPFLELLHQQDVKKHVTAAARFAVNELPDYINECKVVYLPEMGHLMAIKEWEPNSDPQQLQYLGYQFMVCCFYFDSSIFKIYLYFSFPLVALYIIKIPFVLVSTLFSFY